MSKELSVRLVTVTALAILQGDNTVCCITPHEAVVNSRHDKFAKIELGSFVRTYTTYGWVHAIDETNGTLTINCVPNGDKINVEFWNVSTTTRAEYTKSLFKQDDYVIVTGPVNNPVGSDGAKAWTPKVDELIGKMFKIAEIDGEGDVKLQDCQFKYWSPNYLRKATKEEIEKHLEETKIEVGDHVVYYNEYDDERIGVVESLECQYYNICCNTTTHKIGARGVVRKATKEEIEKNINSKFKVDDYVQIVSPYNISHWSPSMRDCIGKVFKIQKVEPKGFVQLNDAGQNSFLQCHVRKATKEEIEKFEIGDHVVYYDDDDKKCIGVVESLQGQFYNICHNNSSHFIDAKFLRKASKEEIVENIDSLYFKVGDYVTIVGQVDISQWTPKMRNCIGKIFKVLQINSDGRILLDDDSEQIYFLHCYLHTAGKEDIANHLASKFKVGDCVLCPSVHSDTKGVLWDVTMTPFVGQIGIVVEKHDVKGAYIVRFGNVSGVFLGEWLIKVKGTPTEIMKQVVNCMTVGD